ncbi:CHAT domain-containing protein [Streptomyces sp. NPDC090106]|uniref:CHAT domain-containing protein n=1 Tax=Streptomyces sp. NPDC090106 TaxID=3365946 RepID=UPI00381C246E
MPSHPPHAPEPATDTVLRVDGSEVSLRLPGRAGVVRQPAGVPDHAADQAWWVLRAWRTRSAATAAAPLRPLDDTARTDPSHADLVAAGAALTRTYLDGPVGDALQDLLRRPPGPHTPHSVGIHVVDAPLRDLPWEALCHPGTSSPLALDPRVALYRAASPGTGHGLESAGQVARRGPLRMLAMIAAPEAYGFARLDIETEQRRLLDITDQDGRLDLHLLGEGSRNALRDAVRGGDFDIVHLSCHGYAHGLCLEGDTGEPDLVPFDRLVEAFPQNTRRPGLLVLSACASARATPTGPFTPRTDLTAPDPSHSAAQLPGLAERFASAGFPAVLAMTAEVSDPYATGFTARLYELLAENPASPLPRTVAAARQELEGQRLSASPEAPHARPDAPRRPLIPAEWGTPTLYAAGRPTGLRATADHPPEEPGRTRSGAGGTRLLVGRRRELQRLLREFWQTGEPVQVTGLGGTGKTALVEELLTRVGVRRERVAQLDDRTSALESLTRMMRALTGRVDPGAAEDLCAPGLTEAERVRRAREWFDTHTHTHTHDHTRARTEVGLGTTDMIMPTTQWSVPPPALVVYDTHASPAATQPPGPPADTEDSRRAAFLTAWASGTEAGARRLVLTSRTPLHLRPSPGAHPEADGGKPMATLPLGPLPRAEARYLARQVPGLGVLRPQDLNRLIDALGGHPRALGFAACLLRATPEAASPGTWPRLMDVLHARGVSDPEQHVRSVAAQGLGGVIGEAAVAAGEDAELPRLWAGLGPDARSALMAAAVFRTPVPAQAFLAPARSPADMAAAMRRTRPVAPRPGGTDPLGELVALGLLSVPTSSSATPSSSEPDADPHVTVPRWISAYLAELAPRTWRFAHRAAVAHWFARLGTGDLERPADVAAADEARYHADQAGMTDEFIGVTGLLCRRHYATGRFDQVEKLSRETLKRVPPDSLLAADAHEGIGDCAHETGDVAAAVVAHEHALAIRRQAGDTPAIAQSLHRLALAEMNLSRHERADVHFQEALDLGEQLGDREEMSRLHHSLALRADRLGDLAAKKRHLDRADELRGEPGGRRTQAARLTERGRLAIDEGRYADALRYFGQALDHDREEPVDRHGIAGTTLLVADVHLRLEQPRELKAHAREALLQNERIGDTDGMLRAYSYLVYAALMEKDLTTARTLAEHHLTLAERSGDIEDHELASNLLAVVARDAGDLAGARERWSACRASAERRGARDSEGRYLHQLGVVAHLDGDPDSACELLGRAGRVLGEAGADAGAAESLCALARVLLTLADERRLPHLVNEALRALGESTLHLNQPDTQHAQLTRNRNVYADLVRVLGRHTTRARLHTLFDACRAQAVVALLDQRNR